jgi:agmatine deiminase
MSATGTNSRYTMPAEWEPHEGTWLQWPGIKVGLGYEMKQEHTWLKMVAALVQQETVHIITNSFGRQGAIHDNITAATHCSLLQSAHLK